MTYDSALDNRHQPSLGTALRRHKLVAIAALVACTAAGTVWGYSQPVEFEAQAQLIAGATSVTTSGLPAQAAASETLAATYSRVFEGDEVQTALREAVGDVPKVEASPIPSTSIILIEAEAETAELAVSAADAGATALEAVVSGLVNNADALTAATTSLTESNTRLAEAERALAAAQAAQSALVNPEADPAISAAVASASAAVGIAEAEVAAAASRYQRAVSESTPGNGVRRLASARVTSDTSVRRVQLGYAVGIVSGCILGGGLAYALASAGARRRPFGVADPS